MVSSMEQDEIKMVDRRGEGIKEVGEFKYLGSIIQKEGGCELEIRGRVQAVW